MSDQPTKTRPQPVIHPELAAQPGERVPRVQQTPAEAQEIDRKAHQHNQVEPRRRAR